MADGRRKQNEFSCYYLVCFAADVSAGGGGLPDPSGKHLVCGRFFCGDDRRLSESCGLAAGTAVSGGCLRNGGTALAVH